MSVLMSSVLLFSVLFPLSANAQTLLTDTYEVFVQDNCEEGNVSCDDVTYISKDKKTGNAIELKGSSLHTICADGKTPCRFLGYVFENNDLIYYVYEDGLLEVIDTEDKVLLREKGEWQ